MAAWRKCVPCACTFAALCAGMGSILAAGAGEFLLGAQLILVSLILDGLDGTLARLLRGQTSFGAELDTFVDITSFGIAPAALLYLHPDGLQRIPFWGLALAFAYAASGAARLSRFRVVDPYRGQRGYLGLPITVAAGFVAAYLIALECPAAACRRARRRACTRPASARRRAGGRRRAAGSGTGSRSRPPWTGPR